MGLSAFTRGAVACRISFILLGPNLMASYYSEWSTEVRMMACSIFSDAIVAISRYEDRSIFYYEVRLDWTCNFCGPMETTQRSL